MARSVYRNTETQLDKSMGVLIKGLENVPKKELSDKWLTDQIKESKRIILRIETLSFLKDACQHVDGNEIPELKRKLKTYNRPREILFAKYWRLVCKVVYNMKGDGGVPIKLQCKYRGIPIIALLTVGLTEGLVEAAVRFDETKGEYKSYAPYWITQKAMAEYLKIATPFGAPQYVWKNIRYLRAAKQFLFMHNEYSEEKLKKFCQKEWLNPKKLNRVLLRGKWDITTIENRILEVESDPTLHEVYSLDYKYGDMRLGDMIGDPKSSNETEDSKMNSFEEILNMSKSLTEKEKEAIRAVILRDEKQTKVGERWGVSRQRINQIIEEGLRKLGNKQRVKEQAEVYGIRTKPVESEIFDAKDLKEKALEFLEKQGIDGKTANLICQYVETPLQYTHMAKNVNEIMSCEDPIEKIPPESIVHPNIRWAERKELLKMYGLSGDRLLAFNRKTIIFEKIPIVLGLALELDSLDKLMAKDFSRYKNNDPASLDTLIFEWTNNGNGLVPLLKKKAVEKMMEMGYPDKITIDAKESNEILIPSTVEVFGKLFSQRWSLNTIKLSDICGEFNLSRWDSLDRQFEKKE